MVWSVCKKELLLQIRDKRIILALGVLYLISFVAVISGFINYNKQLDRTETFQQEIRNQWVHQGERHPHRAAHFGFYVTKPISALSIIEPGLQPAVGQAIWIGAHARSSFSNPLQHDDITQSVIFSTISPNYAIQMLGGLFSLIIGAFSIVREKEDGILRQLLAQGGKVTNWFIGKFFGLLCILIMPVICILVIAGVLIFAFDNFHSTEDLLFRFFGLVGTNIISLILLLLIGMVISVLSSNSRSAFVSAVSLWIILFIIIPRVSFATIEAVAPSISWQQFQSSISEKFNNGFGDYKGYMEQLTDLEKQTLQKHRVDNVTELPVSYSSIRLFHMDEWTNIAGDHEYKNLENRWDNQKQLHMLFSALFPTMALSHSSRGFAATDWDHYRHYAEKTEIFRRDMNIILNQEIGEQLKGDVWEMDSSQNVWETVPEFRYKSPSSDWAYKNNIIFIFIPLAWIFGLIILLRNMLKRIEP